MKTSSEKDREIVLTLVSRLKRELHQISSPLFPKTIAPLNPFLSLVLAFTTATPFAVLVGNSGHYL
jgi:hypothetical protein